MIVSFRTMICAVLGLASIGVSLAAPAEEPPAPPIDKLTQVKRVFIGELTGNDAERMKNLLIEEILAAKLFEVVDDREAADAIFSGTAELVVHQRGFVQGSADSSGANVSGAAGDVPNAMVSVTIRTKSGKILGAFSASTGGNLFSGRGAGSVAANQIVKKIRKQIRQGR